MVSVETKPVFAVRPARRASRISVNRRRRPDFSASPAPVNATHTATTEFETSTVWLSPVTVAITDAAANPPYGIICANNPVNMVDPSGLAGIKFGSFAIGSGDMWMEFDNSSWMEISKGSAATLDGIIPFADPLESAYAEKCGNVESQYKTSRNLGAFARDLYIGARIPNIGQWIKNPILYEIGQTTVPKATYELIQGMNAIEKGRYLLNAANGNYLKAAFGTAWGQVGKTIGTGLTPAGYLFGLGAFEAVDSQTR